MVSIIFLAQNNQNNNTILWIGFGIFFLFFLIIGLTFWTIFRPWLQCFLSGTPISVFQIIGMKLRKTPIQKICELKIMARQAGVDIRWSELEGALLSGVDVELIVRSMIKAHGQDLNISWEEALAQAQQDQFDDYKEQHYGS